MADLIIACLSQKGGVGKSTLARLIARTYAVSGWTVKIADFNTKQLTSAKWAEIRKQAGIEPAIDASGFNQPTAMRREPHNLIVADGRPDSDQSSLDIARLSDLIIIPTGLPLDDLEPQLAFAMELVEKGVPKEKVVFVLNKVTESKRAVQAAREYLASATGFYVAKQEIASKISYQQAQNHGYALSEVEKHVGRLEEVADLLAAEIVDRAQSLGEAA
jgi:chromosome partitioning protein